MTIFPTIIQSVAHPLSDGSQPAGEAHSSRRTPLAAPFPQTGEHLIPGFRNAADQGTAQKACSPVLSPCDPGAGAVEGLSCDRRPIIPTPQASSSQATAGTSALSAHDLGALPLSIDLESLAAWRESQGQPIDAEPKAQAKNTGLFADPWPYTVNREGEIIDMRDGSTAYDLMAQIGLGIAR